MLDIEDREVEVVYDIRLLKRNGKLYVTDVDISRYGLFRRLGLASLGKILYERSGEEKRGLYRGHTSRRLDLTLALYRVS